MSPVPEVCLTLWIWVNDMTIPWETAKQSNRCCYLVFYNDTYASYLEHNEVRVVCQAREDVWLEVAKENLSSILYREFIKQYMEKLPDRKMLSLSESR